MSEYRPDESSPIKQASTALSYRHGRIDGLSGKKSDPFGADADDWAAYRKGYEHGQSERRPKFPILAVAASMAVLVAVFIWWRIG